MRSRAEAAAETGRRIIEAMATLFAEQPFDRITLEMVASRAEVTVQTVLRRFGSKDGLLAATAADARERIAAQRGEARPGDRPGAVRVLFDHYEAWGHLSLRLLEQEERLPEIGALTAEGRRMHAEWVERVFADLLSGREGPAGELLRGQLVAVTDVYVWKVLRLDRGLDRASAERAVLELLEALATTSAQHQGDPSRAQRGA